MSHPCLAFHARPQRRCTAWPWLFLLWTWILTASFGAVELHPSATACLNNTGAWSAALPLDAGAQTLEARAAHPSGHYTATSTSGWTSSGASGRLTLNAAFSGGTVMQRGAAAATQGTGVRVILQGNGSGGYHVLTGFPTP